MYHIWGAPSGVKKLIIFIFYEQYAITFGPFQPITPYYTFRIQISSLSSSCKTTVSFLNPSQGSTLSTILSKSSLFVLTCCFLISKLLDDLSGHHLVEGPYLLSIGDDLRGWGEHAAGPVVPELHRHGVGDPQVVLHPVHAAPCGYVDDASNVSN